MRKNEQKDALKIETYLPIFPGFYGTIFGNDDGQEERQEIVCYLESLGLSYGSFGTAEKVANIIVFNSKLYEVGYKDYEAEYVERMTAAVSKELADFPGFAGLEFESVYSPKEYNFRNDSGNVRLVLSNERLFRAALLRTIRANRAAFAAFLKSRYTSCSGFISHYSNVPADWLAGLSGGLENMGEHRPGALLDFVLAVQGFNEESLYYAAEKPSLSEYMSGPLFDLTGADFNPDGKAGEILADIRRGEKQFDPLPGSHA